MQKLLIIFVFSIPFLASAQLNNYWSQNFNDESSLLAGAVVGGGAGPSAIYYNPATISEINESKLSLNASLFSFEFLKVSNALGDGIDLNSAKSYVIPRFLSYMLKPKKYTKWSFEVAFLNLANLSTEGVNYVNKDIDILSYIPGKEKYTAFYKLSTRYRDDWVGIGTSYKLNENLSLGTSMFASFLSQYSYHTLQIDARPIINDLENLPDSYDMSSYDKEEEAKFNDYRLMWKFGVFYKKDRYGFGLNISTPTLSGIYSDGKRVMRRISQNNITDPESGEPKNNFLLLDYEEKKNVMVKSKSPFSIAAGITYYNSDKTKILYFTAQYFAEMKAYAIVKANRNPSLENNSFLQDEEYRHFLTFVEGGKPVFNAAIGYKWFVKENLMLLAGFKTDFNYEKDYDLKPFSNELTLESFNFNKFHITGGSTAHIFGQDVTAGIQYTLGFLNNQKQVVNLSDPVEYNNFEQKALQGTRLKNMNTIYSSVSIYLAATFNFGRGKAE